MSSKLESLINIPEPQAVRIEASNDQNLDEVPNEVP